MERGRSSFVEPSPLVGEGEGEGGSGPHEPGGSAIGRRWNGELMGLVSYPARHQENQQYMERSGSLDQNEASGQGGMRTGRTRDADNQRKSMRLSAPERRRKQDRIPIQPRDIPLKGYC